MIRFCLAAALMVALPQDDPDKAAAELLKKVEERLMTSKAGRIEFEGSDSGGQIKIKGEFTFGEGGSFLYKVTADYGSRVDEIMIRSDGRTVRGSGTRVRTDPTPWKPEATLKCLRRIGLSAHYMGAYLVSGGPNVNPETAFVDFEPQEVKGGGKETIGKVETSIVTCQLVLTDGPPGGLQVKLWIDPKTLTILKRTLSFGPRSVDETTPRFDLAASFPKDHFEFQTEAMLLDGRASQLAASIALHARYTGRLPKTLDDLNRRPADLPPTTFWPECGFWIGGALPKDIAYSFDATHFNLGAVREAIPGSSPIGAPDDRLKKHLEARVRIQLLKAAAAGFRRATGAGVKEAQDLIEKPDSARLWPEGGWIGGGSLPVDPWGDAFIIRAGDPLSVSLAKPQGRMLRQSELTPEQRKALDAAAFPALGDKEASDVRAQVKRLGSETLSDREAATQAIIAKGVGALQLVEQVLAAEKDPEVMSRLALIRDRFRAVKPSWMAEFQGKRHTVVGTRGDPAAIPDNERQASTSLKTLTTAQADFRSNDRDGNRTIDFYVRDVAGLYGLKPAIGADTEATAGKVGEGHAINKLIEPSLAKADTTEGRWTYPVLEITEPEPKSGYFFAALKQGELGGKVVTYHAGDGRNADMFGFVAYPAEYGVTGRMTFIVNEDNTIWQKDTGGEDIDLFPASPPADGWRKMD